ncbi:MAG TPA: tetratricopeptide repeat protein, partial [Rhizomicrobium sp.]|nr:tetratricopeptide repeat protein [Rhizomicrobium sp.]
IHQALDLLGHAAAQAPGEKMIQADFANALRLAGRKDEAFRILERVLAQDPHFAPARERRGYIHWEQEKREAALADFQAVLRHQPGRADLGFFCGTILDDLGRPQEALAAYDQVLAHQPRHVDALNSRGWGRLQLGRFEAGLSDLTKATLLAPQFPGARLNLAHYRLLHGDFERGLPLYEARKEMPGQAFVRLFQQPQWDGKEDLAGKRLLVHAEQGLGDTIQFCRYLALLQDTGAEIHFALPASLHRLMAGAGFAVTITEAPRQGFDCQIPLMSLPLALGTRLATIPSSPRYLAAEPARAVRWRQRLGSHGFRIGICWHGRYEARARDKCFSPAALAPVARLPGLRLVSLQIGEALGELAGAGIPVEVFEDLDAGTDAFLDTAAVMANCDLVISADSAPAHLAGALGVPAWIALKHVPDWRWFMGRSDSPWYPSLRLFRQPATDDWGSVFRAMEDALISRPLTSYKS